MFTPHGENREFKLDQWGAGTCKFSVGDVPYAWQQRRSSRLSGKTGSLNSTNEGLAHGSSVLAMYVMLGNNADVHASRGKPRI